MSRGERTCKESVHRGFPRALAVSSLADGHSPDRAFPSAVRCEVVVPQKGPCLPALLFLGSLPIYHGTGSGSSGFGSQGTTGWNMVIWVNFDLKTNLSLQDEFVEE